MLVAVVALAVGVAVGFLVARRTAATPAPGDQAGGPVDPPLPAEVIDLLVALPASGIVLDARQSVVACSPTAVSHGWCAAPR